MKKRDLGSIKCVFPITDPRNVVDTKNHFTKEFQQSPIVMNVCNNANSQEIRLIDLFLMGTKIFPLPRYLHCFQAMVRYAVLSKSSNDALRVNNVHFPCRI